MGRRSAALTLVAMTTAEEKRPGKGSAVLAVFAGATIGAVLGGWIGASTYENPGHIDLEGELFRSIFEQFARCLPQPKNKTISRKVRFLPGASPRIGVWVGR